MTTSIQFSNMKKILKNPKGHLIANDKDQIVCDNVSVLTINGKTYRAYRGIKYNGRDIEKVKEYVECEGKKVQCRLKEVWPLLVKDLFK